MKANNYGETVIPLLTPEDFEAVESDAQRFTLTWAECAHLNRDIARQRRWQHADRMAELSTEGRLISR